MDQACYPVLPPAEGQGSRCSWCWCRPHSSAWPALPSSGRAPAACPGLLTGCAQVVTNPPFVLLMVRGRGSPWADLRAQTSPPACHAQEPPPCSSDRTSCLCPPGPQFRPHFLSAPWPPGGPGLVFWAPHRLSSPRSVHGGRCWAPKRPGPHEAPAPGGVLFWAFWVFLWRAFWPTALWTSGPLPALAPLSLRAAGCGLRGSGP